MNIRLQNNKHVIQFNKAKPGDIISPPTKNSKYYMKLDVPVLTVMNAVELSTGLLQQFDDDQPVNLIDHELVIK